MRAAFRLNWINASRRGEGMRLHGCWPAHLLFAALVVAPHAPLPAAQTEAKRPQLLEISLEDAVELASLGSSKVDRTEREARIAALKVKSARAAYFPRVDVAISANQSARGSVVRSSDNAFQQGLVGDFKSGVSVSANVPIDVSGIIARRVRRNRIGENIAELELERARTEMIADTQVAYLQALKAQRSVELDQQVIASIRRLQESATNEAQPIASFLRIELASARQTLNARRGDLEQAQDHLKRSLGLEPEVKLVLSSNLPEPERLESIAVGSGVLSDRKDLEVARKRLDQAELGVVQASDHRRPSVRAGIFLDQFFGGKFVSDTGETSTRNFGLNLSLNFPVLNFDAGQSGNTKKIAELQADQARQDLRDAVRQAEYDLKQARASWARALERTQNLPSAKDASLALTFAERNLLNAPAEEAPSRLAQVSNARTAWRQAEAAAGDAVIELAVAAIRLRKAEGRVLDATDLLAEADQDPRS
ncbi:MAG TPA: TolC family protein [Sphingomicrobium sp.]|nr:TolC family protein [Sphingomicrobium sp.]